MKGYLILLLAVAALLLLLPLPALNVLQPDKPPASDTSSGHTTTSRTEGSATALTSASEESSGTTHTTAAGDNTETAAAFRVLDAAADRVVEISERDFIIGTLAAEMYPSYHPEALKAQAVAAYTYYSWRREQARAAGDDRTRADFSDVPAAFPRFYTAEGLRERWGGSFDEYYEKLAAAADAVAGKRMVYHGEPVMAVWHAISFGNTESAADAWGEDVPYLRSVPADEDKLSPGYQSVVTVTADQFKEMVEQKFNVKLTGDAGNWIDLSSVKRSEAGSVAAVTVGEQAVTGAEMRAALGLRSPAFTIGYDPDSGGVFTFTVSGYGHGVGMSQYGADYMARQDSDWKEILCYYYTGVEIV
ncbi:MAG: stage II sporulation protein D [Oscillospiraceae bacterium]|nr:stage II sporulation protein D [Oscillospiraceae bacterium]